MYRNLYDNTDPEEQSKDKQSEREPVASQSDFADDGSQDPKPKG